MFPANGFTVDSNNAHTQPDGAYHYHGPPPIVTGDANTPSGVIGFAADGFPIYGPWFESNRRIAKARSSYRLKSGTRPSGPGGAYDGAFVDDYEYVEGLGDLDACNGQTVNGQYGYYITETYPFILGCFSGTPHPSFTKTGGGGERTGERRRQRQGDGERPRRRGDGERPRRRDGERPRRRQE